MSLSPESQRKKKPLQRRASLARHKTKYLMEDLAGSGAASGEVSTALPEGHSPRTAALTYTGGGAGDEPDKQPTARLSFDPARPAAGGVDDQESGGGNGEPALYLWGDWNPVLDPPIAVELSSQEKFATVSFGVDFVIALTDRGRVYGWGGNTHGALGVGDKSDRSDPALALGLVDETVVGIATGKEHCACVTSRGEVFTWGSNTSGQLGHGDRQDRAMPTVVDELASERSLCQAVSCGDRFSCALTRTGRLFAWGRQGGATDAGTTEYFVDSRVPVPIDFPGTATRIRSIGCYGAKVAALPGEPPSARGSTGPTPQRAVGSTGGGTPDEFVLESVQQEWHSLMENEKAMFKLSHNIRETDAGEEWSEEQRLARQLAGFAEQLADALKLLMPIKDRAQALQDEFQGATVAQLFLAYANLRVEHVQILLREVREAERTRRVGGLRFQLEQCAAGDVVAPKGEAPSAELRARYRDLLRASSAATNELALQASRLEARVASEGYLFPSAQASALVTDLAGTRMMLNEAVARGLDRDESAGGEDDGQPVASGPRTGVVAHRLAAFSRALRGLKASDKGFSRVVTEAEVLRAALAGPQEEGAGGGAEPPDTARSSGSRKHKKGKRAGKKKAGEEEGVPRHHVPLALVDLLLDYAALKKENEELRGKSKKGKQGGEKGETSLFNTFGL